MRRGRVCEREGEGVKREVACQTERKKESEMDQSHRSYEGSPWAGALHVRLIRSLLSCCLPASFLPPFLPSLPFAMSFAALALTLAQTTRATVPRLTPGSSSLFRFMSSQGESESSRQKNAHVAPTQTTTSTNYQGRKPKKVYVHNSNGNFSGNNGDPSHSHSSNNGSSFVKPQDNPNLHRLFFRSPDKLGSLEEAQVFISHIKSNYGPLTQYQFSRVCYSPSVHQKKESSVHLLIIFPTISARKQGDTLATGF